MHLPGYDEWKLGDPNYISAEEEAALIEKDREQKESLREAIAAMLYLGRGDVYLADIRQIVVEELNKMQPGAGEPEWQTAVPVKLPPY